MKNLLYIAPYYNTDGWGEASRGYLSSLMLNENLNITTHPIYYHNNIDAKYHTIYSQYETKKYENYDYVIQKCIVGDFVCNSAYKKNIGITEIETSNWKCCVESIRNINELDELWVPSRMERDTLIKSGVKIPIKTISQPLDTLSIKQHKNHKLDLPNSIKSNFVFYTIAEFVERKNLEALITAFAMAFDYTEPVSLVIKSSVPGKTPQESKAIIENMISTIKQQIRYKNKFKKEYVISNYLEYKEIIGLHNACDCFVMTSYGEAFCRPAAEALVLGKTPIINKNTGSSDYINDSNGYLINSKKTPVMLNNPPLSNNYDFYDARQHWYEIDIYHLIETMQDVYQNRHQLKDKKAIGISQIDNFSYSNIGNNLCM